MATKQVVVPIRLLERESHQLYHVLMDCLWTSDSYLCKTGTFLKLHLHPPTGQHALYLPSGGGDTPQNLRNFNTSILSFVSFCDEPEETQD